MSIKKRCVDRARSRSFAKKGQVTVFIIIGIIILFAFAGILYFTNTTSKQQLAAQGSPVRGLSQTFTPVQSFTENCMLSVAEEGLRILGEQGGYIFPDLVGEYVPDTTESDGLLLDPLQIPYWHYNSLPNQLEKVQFATLRPALGGDTFSVESQLGRYVAEQLPVCLDNYAALAGFSIQAGSVLRADVSINDADVSVLLQMPVQVALGESKDTIDQFYVAIPMEFQHYYEIASLIMEQERDTGFLERQGLELLSVFSRKDPQFMAPTSGIGFEYFSPVQWSEQQLTQDFQGLLTSYIPLLRFLGSSNFNYYVYPEGNLLAQKVNDNMVLPLTGAEDLEISFDYFGWKPYLKTNSEDGIVKPENLFVSYERLNFGQQRYETHYDISYPVLVTLHDRAAFDGEGYTFKFAMEANIRNNDVAVGGEPVAPYPRSISNLGCDSEQRTSELLTLKVIDSYTKEPIDFTNIGFSIPNYEDCQIGLTNSEGLIEEQFPNVYGGVVNLINPGYLTTHLPVDTYSIVQPTYLGYEVDGETVVELDKVREIPVSVQKKELKKCVMPLECQYTIGPFLHLPIPYKDIECEQAARECFFNQGQGLLLGEPVISYDVNASLSKRNEYYFINKPQDLDDKEQVFLNLERVKGFNEEVVGQKFNTFVSLSGKEKQQVSLVPGLYKISGLVTLDEEVKIPAEERCFSYDILTYEDEECFSLQENVLDQYITGNLQWDTEDLYVEITPDDLYTADELTLFVVTQDILSVPLQMTTESAECGGFTCLPSVGCLFDVCKDKDVTISGRLLEDLNVPAEIVNVAKKKRKELEPVFK